PVSSATSWARGSRKRRTISPLKSPRWPADNRVTKGGLAPLLYGGPAFRLTDHAISPPETRLRRRSGRRASPPRIRRAVQYRRVLLKCSGEALMGPTPYGIDFETVDRITAEVKSVHELGAQVSLVIGGGNIF